MTDKLWQSAAAGIPGVACAVLGQAITDPKWALFGTILLWCGVLLLAISGAILLAWLAFQAAEVRSDFVRANAWDIECAVLHERGNVIDRVKGLTPGQEKIVLDNVILRVSYRLFSDVPLVYPTSATYEFFYEFIRLSDEMFLCPIGGYKGRPFTEGSDARRWAKEITDMFISTGEAEPARGNLPARWVAPQIFSQYKILADRQVKPLPHLDSEPV